jgi:hypothetical protein
MGMLQRRKALTRRSLKALKKNQRKPLSTIEPDIGLVFIKTHIYIVNRNLKAALKTIHI